MIGGGRQRAARWAPLRTGLRLATGSLAVLGLVVVVATATPLVSWWATALAGPRGEPEGDVLIVLGGSVLGDGLLGESSYWRSVYAVRVWRKSRFREVVVAGGGPGATPVGVSIRDFLECQGLPTGAIAVEPRSRSTRENALYVRRLLAGTPGRKVLLTSDYHMFRARRAFEKVGLVVEPWPFPDIRKRGMRWTNRWDCLVDLLVESLKIGYYRARGWI